MKTKVFISVVTLAAFALFAFAPKSALQPKPWPVPDAWKNKVNPIKGQDLDNGKALWSQHCKSCHGSKGKGDGPKAAQLDTDAGDFTKAAFQSQTDGALYYKTYTGRDDMPSYKSKIPDANDNWALVNYMRTFK
jgi:mono/diheme cytochrome c family protein